MAHVRHVVVSVQIAAALFIEQILHPPANDLDRLSVRDAQVLAERPASGRQRFSLVRLPRRKTAFGYAENQIRVWREPMPNVALARAADARKITIGIEQISDDLKCRCGVHPPFSPGEPRLAIFSPFATGLPTLSHSSDSALRCP